ncbi:hypothetical protein SAMN05421820_114109 [Pedobacter steynii]|uniref:Uncharacterized protein n=2 Tax=Pedobacter steynii TaxID=430522 RepID=A0A1H0J8J6_9SPHI|nr:hypothetical protein SAMN05421820_114109 [Pedobacter steynii]
MKNKFLKIASVIAFAIAMIINVNSNFARELRLKTTSSHQQKAAMEDEPEIELQGAETDTDTEEDTGTDTSTGTDLNGNKTYKKVFRNCTVKVTAKANTSVKIFGLFTVSIGSTGSALFEIPEAAYNCERGGELSSCTGYSCGDYIKSFQPH